MTAPLSITCPGYIVHALHMLADHDRSKDAREACRRRTVAMVMAGAARHVVARAQGTTMQSVRDWVLRFHSGGPSIGYSPLERSSVIPSSRYTYTNRNTCSISDRLPRQF